MKKSVILILAIIFVAVFNITATAKEKVQPPQVTLTFADGTVFKGFLRCNLHAVDKKIYVSRDADGKSESYKIEDLKELSVTYSNGEKMTFSPIYVWDGFYKKMSKTPVLASVCYSSDNITGYMTPGMYIKSTTPVPSNYFQSYTTQRNAWVYYKRIKSESDKIEYLYTYIPSKKTPSLKKILRDVKNNFSKEDFKYIEQIFAAEGVTAEDIIKKPWLFLEVLDKKK